MDRHEVRELQYIAPLANLPSIAQVGILSHRRAERVPHSSVALEEIQALRQKAVPQGRFLHEYANLYFDARNPMLSRRLDRHREICVIAVHPDVLDLDDVVITDGNAASKYTRFSPSPRGLSTVNSELTFAERWTHQDQIEYWRRKSAKCAEVLVPNLVPVDYLMHVYVSCEEALERGHALKLDIEIRVNRHLFFDAG